MNDISKKATRITVTLSDRDYETLRAMSREADVSLSWIVRHAVDDFLRRIEETDEPQLPFQVLPDKGGR